MKTNVMMLLLFCCGTYLNAQYNYPATPVKAVINDYNGVKITDNYRWLEDMKNPEVTGWFKKQADFSKNFIEKISGRDQLFSDMKYLDDLKSEDYYNAKKSGNNYFYTKILFYNYTLTIICKYFFFFFFYMSFFIARFKIYRFI